MAGDEYKKIMEEYRHTPGLQKMASGSHGEYTQMRSNWVPLEEVWDWLKEVKRKGATEICVVVNEFGEIEIETETRKGEPATGAFGDVPPHGVFSMPEFGSPIKLRDV